MVPHPHHEVITAFLEGRTVQKSTGHGAWDDYIIGLCSGILPGFDPRDQWRIKPVEVRRWYVHDRFDTLADYVTIGEAAKMAQHAIDDGNDGIHMIYATPEENAEYCNTGKFPFSNK